MTTRAGMIRTRVLAGLTLAGLLAVAACGGGGNTGAAPQGGAGDGGGGSVAAANNLAGTEISVGKVMSNFPATKPSTAVERFGMIVYSTPSR